MGLSKLACSIMYKNIMELASLERAGSTRLLCSLAQAAIDEALCL
jgi:hypothetical protein